MSKRINEIKKTIPQSGQPMSINDAISIIKSYSLASYNDSKNNKINLVAKFHESVDISVKLGTDGKKSDQNVRFPFILPHGNGRKIKILSFTNNVDVALANGCDYAGSDELISSVLSESVSDFNVCLCEKSMMPKVAKLARILGPKGMMPSDKIGTVFNDEEQMKELISEIKKGRCSVKSDQYSYINLSLGRINFSEDSLIGNYNAFIDALKKNRPSALKGVFIIKITLSTTMSPLSLNIDFKS